MPVRDVSFHPRRTFQTALLTSVSALTLFTAAAPAQARNILSQATNAVLAAQTAAVSSAQQATAAAQAAQSSLARVTQAIQAMQAAQSAARNLVLSAPGAVPNGLGGGGLVPDSGLAAPGVANPVTTWVGANTPTQSTSNGQTTVSIQQTQPQALLNWKTFNVGTQTTVDFNQQGNATWVALNKIAATGSPSQILGAIKADGQVYLINPNGIIFGGSAQVNVNALIASAADISPTQFFNNGIYSTQSGSTYVPSFTNAGGAITVDAGAIITTPAPSTVDAGGGYVMLLGTQVANNGAILTPQGQTVLAAGDNFLIRPGYSTSSNQSSTTAGNEVAVQLNTLGSSTTGGSGIVANNGYIEADTGDITLVGETVTQNGILLSTTDVTQRGTIHLLNSATDSFGSVTLTGNSVTDILPDLSSGATAVAAQRAGLIAQSGSGASTTGQFDDLSTLADLQNESRVEIVSGGSVEFQGNSLTQAPGGQVAASAVGRIQVDSGATIDVSGSNITLPMIDNLMQINIQGEEESDDPQNRTTGDLFDANVWIDERSLLSVPAGTGGYSTARYYSAGGVLNVTGEYADVGSTIGQWTASGGTITLSTGANGAVVAQSGSVFDIAGGSITYQGGMVPQSWLMGSNGRIYNANTAPSDITYVGIYKGFVVDHARWGISETYVNALGPGAPTIYQPGYTVGRDAGQLVINAPTAVFEGQIEAGVVDGVNQTAARPATITDPFLESQTTAPLQGALTIDPASFVSQSGAAYSPAVAIGGAEPLADTITITTTIPTDRVGTVVLDANQLNGFDLGGLTIGNGVNGGGSITVNEPLALADGGQISLTAASISLNADLTVHGGAITAQAGGFNPNGASVVAELTVAPNVTLDATGLWTNAELDPANQAGLAYLNGGAVTLTSTGDLVLGAGSLIDASSGAAILTSGATEGGAGGAITLAANDRAAGESELFGPQGLVLDGTLRSEGVIKGGALTLSTNGLVTIDDQALLPGGMLAAGTAAPTVLTLTSSLTIPAGAAAPVVTKMTETTVSPGQALPSTELPTLPSGGQVVAANWTVPSFFQGAVNTNHGTVFPGNTVPAGSVITSWDASGYGNKFPAGYIVPANIFPTGWTVAPYLATIPVGATLTSPLTLAAGTIIPQGTVLPQSVSIQELNLTPDFFSQGFSAYNIQGQNLVVAPNTAVNVTMPVLQFSASSAAVPTGARAESALTLALPPLYAANPTEGVLTQRAGASVTLSVAIGQSDAVADFLAGASGTAIAPLTIGQGAMVTVDPGQSVSLKAEGEIDVEGTINAPGGAISVLNTRPYEFETTAVGDTADPALSIWIGSSAVLNAAGQATTALDLYGRPYGVVQNGGSITISGTDPGTTDRNQAIQTSSDAFVVIRPGAVLDASGAAASTLDYDAGQSAGLAGVARNPQSVAGNGGAITLSSDSGLYIEGSLKAPAGGAGAAGGTLSLTLESPIYDSSSPSSGPFSLGDGARQLRILTIDQVAGPSGLSTTLAPGQTDPDLLVGNGQIGVDQITAAGFANLSLYAADAIAFSGNVNLSLAQSLSLNQGAISLAAATPNAQVTLSAPYVLLSGEAGHVPNPGAGEIEYVARAELAPTGTGVLTINADQINIQNDVVFGGAWTLTKASGSAAQDLPGFPTIDLNSQGDITFQSGTIPGANSLGFTGFITTGNLDLTAARIYPATDVIAVVIAGYAPGQISPTGKITIANVGSAPDAAVPDSAFGTLVLVASDIEQGGVVEAPLGALVVGSNDPDVTGGFVPLSATSVGTATLNLLPGSITSVSGNGLVLPYGGTSDGINYLYNGTAVTYVTPFEEDGSTIDTGGVTYRAGLPTQGLALSSQSIVVQPGAVLDVSGGGSLTGAGFVSGEGGSVDVLRNPLVSANPTNVGAATDQVYAIVPSYSGAYAPVSPDAGAGNPRVGEQVTIGAGVPGLPAGTYTLLPSTYALQPGAFRVEIGGANASLSGVASLPNGSFETAGDLGVANTGFRNASVNAVILTPASVVTDYSQYNQTSYAQFAEQQAKTFGSPLPQLPMDAKLLVLDYGVNLSASAPALSMQGTLVSNPAQEDGFTGAAGTLIVTTGFGESTSVSKAIDILGPGDTPVAGDLSLNASDLDNFHAGALVIGGYDTEMNSVGSIADNTTTPTNIVQYKAVAGNVTVEPGAVLTAPQIFLLSNRTVTIDSGATVSTIGQGAAPWDSSKEDVVAEIVGVGFSNGYMTVLPYVTAAGGATDKIVVQDGATLLAGGTLAFEETNGLTLGAATLGAADLSIATSSVNIGTSASLAAAQSAGVLPAGWSLSQDTLDALIAGDSGAGVPALQTLTLSVSNSVNFFGSVDLSTIDPATGKSDLSLVLNTPAIYGYGSAADVATLTTGTLFWNGVATGAGTTVASAAPPPAMPNGPGTGVGTLDLIAQQIVFGYGPNTQPQDQATLNRLALGFSTVNLEASGSITANSTGTLSVYQSQTSGPNGPVGNGGALNLVTPLLTGEVGSVMGYTSGGALSITAPAGAAPVQTATINTLGAEVDLTASSVTIDTAVALPSGKLSVNASGDVQLGADADIDLAGRATPMFDQTEYSWGGDAIVQSGQGSITQAAGSVIDVSASHNAAGSIQLTATDLDLNGAVITPGAGQALMQGTLLGSGDVADGYAGGTFNVRAQQIGADPANLSSDFATLNTTLDTGGFFGGRSFDLKQGSLGIAAGQTIKAQTVSISIDGGSLDVAGTVDASGAAPGAITLASTGDLTLAGTALLDAHGSVLQADSYGNPIDAENRATVELTSTTGTLTLGSGATIDLSSPDPIPQGQLILSAPRLGGSGVSATSSQTITDPVDGALTTGANAPANAQGNDIAIAAGGPITIKGAQSIALNAFATYKNAPVDPHDANGQVVDQAYLGLIDQDSQAFISNVYGGVPAAGVLTSGLEGKLAGLTAYGAAFHLRPGVEIDSATPAGDLTVTSDIDLSDYRYGPNVTSTYGSGEPIALVMRAGNDFTVSGSISDGFQAYPQTPGIAATFELNPLSVSDLTGSLFSLTGTNYHLLSGNTLTVTQPGGWLVPFLPNGNGLSSLQRPQDSANIRYASGSIIPFGTILKALFIPVGEETSINGLSASVQTSPAIPAILGGPATSAAAEMLAPGSLSASIRLVSGADLSSADTRSLSAASAQVNAGNMLLDGAQQFDSNRNPIPNVIRTGTGNLELYTGGNFSQNTLYGIYTAGTQSADVTSAYETPSATSALVSYQAYYPTSGGDLILVAQGDVTGLVVGAGGNSNNIGNWLWKQGGAGVGQPAAWWINFGTFETSGSFEGFSGIGTLGGGNLTVVAGGNAGVETSASALAAQAFGNQSGITSALNLTVASTGRVLADGTPEETGGGALTLDVGGALNPGVPSHANGFSNSYNQDFGVFTDLRGNALIKAGSVGQVALTYGLATADDPRPSDPLAAIAAVASGGPVLAPGDSFMSVETRDDLALGFAVDPGRQLQYNQTVASAGGQAGDAVSWFTLWTPTSGVALMSAGGNISPENQLKVDNQFQGVDAFTNGSTSTGGYGTYLYPPTLRVVALTGDIYSGSANSNYSNGEDSIELAPSPVGEIQMLAGQSIYNWNGGAGSNAGNIPLIWSISGAAPSTEATPFDPGYALFASGRNPQTAITTNDFNPSVGTYWGALFAFGPDTPSTDLHAGDSQPALFYAVNSSIDGLIFGQVTNELLDQGPANGTSVIDYRGAKAVDIRAGQDIVDLGAPYLLPVSTTAHGSFPNVETFILNANPTDVSVIQAGGNIDYANVVVGGPGTLEVMAGGNIYQGDHGLIESIGPVYDASPYDHSSGANIIVMPGVGAAGPDWSAFSSLYLNPANQGDPEKVAADVAQTYQDQLYQWLQQTYGYAGTEADALTYFQSLPVPQQSVFDLKVYFSELNTSGLEFNDPTSLRYKSYIRGREAIATLFPATNAAGQPITYDGGLTLESGSEQFYQPTSQAVLPTLYDSGIHTEFGGNVQIVDPGGAVTVGANAITPGSGTGILTEGSGDVDIYALNSVELGLSRIFTTFGGNIVIWSADGDINAGRGAKGTTVFTPARRVYTDYGVVALSPTVPSSGAGIATLAPIPEVPAGNINLIAPLGIVDAGEAGIRVSGNINIAALQVINAANITVQGTSTGIPTAAAPNIGALTTAASAAGAAVEAAQATRQGNRVAQQDLPSIITVEVIGYGGGDGTPAPQPQDDQRRRKPVQQSENQVQDPRSRVQVLGAGDITEEQAHQLMQERRVAAQQ